MEVNKPMVITFFTVLFTQFLFVALKQMHVIDWDWFWIVSPLWIPYLLFLLFLCAFGACIVIENIIVERKKKRGNRLSNHSESR